jgi:hypothetical protein
MQRPEANERGVCWPPLLPSPSGPAFSCCPRWRSTGILEMDGPAAAGPDQRPGRRLRGVSLWVDSAHFKKVEDSGGCVSGWAGDTLPTIFRRSGLAPPGHGGSASVGTKALPSGTAERRSRAEVVPRHVRLISAHRASSWSGVPHLSGSASRARKGSEVRQKIRNCLPLSHIQELSTDKSVSLRCGPPGSRTLPAGLKVRSSTR